MTDEDVEAAGLIDLTDQVQDDAETVGSNLGGGGCMWTILALLVLISVLFK